jgi:hypothetical protein
MALAAAIGGRGLLSGGCHSGYRFGTGVGAVLW